ncbi:MAG: di-trans,poly-cis-decaprenylcistransferase [Mollicutes bacterium]|nr:di-trans,poly-cis-decaprenylcistransferase [Mollicutes bacterium]
MIDDKLKHLAIIMDGNGRWAQKKGLIRSLGHKEGAKALEKIAIYANKIGIKYLSVYAFSTDNFKRSEAEVTYLMDLFVDTFSKQYSKYEKNNIKVIFSGTEKGLRKDVIKTMHEIKEKTKDNTGGVLNICLNYGGQEEIIRAAERYHEDLANKRVKKIQINRDNFYQYLDNNLPPVDLMVRTGGEKRLSNFLLYQLTYAELYFIDDYFPDFTPKILEKIIDNFYKRDRKFGGINEKKNKN